MCALEFKEGNSYMIWFNGDHNYTIKPFNWTGLNKDAVLTLVKKGDTTFYTHKDFVWQSFPVVENQRNKNGA